MNPDFFTFYTVDQDNNEIECVALHIKFSKQTGKKYLLYTDNSIDPADGCTKVFAAFLNPNDDGMTLHPIETQEDFNFISNMFSEFETEYYGEN